MVLTFYYKSILGDIVSAKSFLHGLRYVLYKLTTHAMLSTRVVYMAKTSFPTALGHIFAPVVLKILLLPKLFVITKLLFLEP